MSSRHDALPPDGTLGGYIREHNRPPAFLGSDGYPYSVSLETEKVASLTRPYEGYLVFPRWAETGVGIVGHEETPTLARGATPEEAVDHLKLLPLEAVKEFLEEAIRRRRGPVQRSLPGERHHAS